MDGRTTLKTHYRSGSGKSLSWGDGVTGTKRIFDEIVPCSDATEQTLDDVAKAFRERSRAPLKNSASSSPRSLPPVLASDTLTRTPPLRTTEKRPPLSNSAGLATGHGQLLPIGDDSWSESSRSRQQHRRGGSHGTVISVLTAESSSSARKFSGSRNLPPSGRPMTPVENQLMNKLLAKAYNNRSKSADQMSYSASSAGTSFEASYTSRNSELDFKPPRRVDDNSSLASTEYSVEPSASGRSGESGEELSPEEKKFIRMYFQDLEEERVALMKQWREEFEQEQRGDASLTGVVQNMKDKVTTCTFGPVWKCLSYVEVFIANMPLTIGAVGLSWVTQGVIWFKFMEENIDACTTVRFNSPQCIYPEFPGCFVCDVTNPIYHGVVTFHYFCHIAAFTCCLLFMAKCIIAWRVVADELSNPATSTPCGVVCITMICVSAGRGLVGEFFVVATSIFHVLLSFWFLYVAIYKYRLWPDPGWFPNTVGIAYASVKTWLYFPIAGLGIMGLCMAYLFAIFPVAMYRAIYNHKIAAPVCFISLSAPSITMYAMTIMAQSRPSGEAMIESDPAFASRWKELHREYYMPVQHGMMILSLIGFIASLYCLWTRWPQFKLKAFSPAHMAFIFPILSHTNAVQAYRAGFDSFSNDPPGSPFRVILYCYWLTCLVIGTILNLVFTYNYVSRLPKWTKISEALFLGDTDEIPPSPSHTLVHEMMSVGSYMTPERGRRRRNSGIPHEILGNFTSPAVLQANEAGALIRVRRGTEDYEHYGPYVRTRNVSSLGFDLTMTSEELRQEHAELLHWVATNAPRTRHRTLSIPQMFKLRSSDGDDEEAGGHHGIYGTFHCEEAAERQAPHRSDSSTRNHQRSQTWGASPV